ncbi:metallophosphoesterase [Roseomonas haemaphysalidis]|uniref:Metallophosphoesterase n=1 Tax=Roseomonas haemaphysalidis TaxID=2768162 RepID=A0ABS3KRZ6_9PROT|nr:metallophosphoesterase [Roseomonas haemaphysalidis]MBO1080231.1 metallophosphoesterase [Roseomonas haemaphysalidis]
MNAQGASPAWPSLSTLRPAFKGLRVVGDVHGDATAFSAAIEGARAKQLFTLQLGDLTDRGPDSAATLRMALALLAERQGLFLLGNHDHKLRRALAGALVRPDPEGLGVTLSQIAAAPDADTLRTEALEAIGHAPAWLRLGPWLFVHGGFHPRMLREPPPPAAGSSKPDGLVPRAMFGQVTSRTRVDGYPERLHNWVHRIPSGITVYCGHETRSADGRPYVAVAAAGGRAVFLDTGAGKGGHLSWIDLPW